MKLRKILLPLRIAVGIAVPLALIAGALFLYYFQWGPECVFHNAFGLYCPGCGAGRACVALLHGDVWEAIKYNPLFVAVLPIAVYFLVKIYVSFVFRGRILPFPRIGCLTAIIIIVAVILFGVLRNIPIAPFTYLAP